MLILCDPLLDITLLLCGLNTNPLFLGLRWIVWRRKKQFQHAGSRNLIKTALLWNCCLTCSRMTSSLLLWKKTILEIEFGENRLNRNSGCDNGSSCGPKVHVLIGRKTFSLTFKRPRKWEKKDNHLYFKRKAATSAAHDGLLQPTHEGNPAENKENGILPYSNNGTSPEQPLFCITSYNHSDWLWWLTQVENCIVYLNTVMHLQMF